MLVIRIQFGSRFTQYTHAPSCLLIHNELYTLTVRWEDETARERTDGHPP